MKRVTGIGGIFFKARDPERLKGWYREHLGIEPDADGYVSFRWRELDDPARVGYTVWSPFPADTTYFELSRSPYMVNYRVADLDALLEALRREGVKVEDRVEEYEYGRFPRRGWNKHCLHGVGRCATLRTQEMPN